MLGILAQRGRRSGRFAFRALLANCALLGLPLLASFAPAVANAGSLAMVANAAGNVPGGATQPSATRLETERRYRGAVAEPGQQIWYRLNSEDAERMIFLVRGKTPSCPIRASVLDVYGRTLAQLISSPRETLPFVVRLPAHPASNTYYLRIDADPFLVCDGAGYAFTLFEPEQPTSCEADQPEGGGPIHVCSMSSPSRETPRGGNRPSPTFETRDCDRAGTALWRATLAVARERSLVARRRGSIGTLRRLESERHRLALRARYDCIGS